MAKSKAFLAVVLATLLVVGFVFAEEEETDEDPIYIQLSGVRNLTRATLDDVRQGDWLLVIVAQWCGFSRNIVSKLSVIAHNLQQPQVAVIDGEEDPSIHIQFSLDSYPFICYVHDGAIHVFDGIPEWDVVLKWALSEWKDVKPLEGPKNPFGWQMTVIGATTHFIWTCYDFVVRNAALVNIPPSVAFSIIFGLTTVIALICIVCCVVRDGDDLIVPLPAPKKASGKEKAAKKDGEAKPDVKKAKEDTKPQPQESTEKSVESKKPKNSSEGLRKRKSAKRVE